ELAMPSMLWCSATQKRVKPAASAQRASARALPSASPGVPPTLIGARSSTEMATVASRLTSRGTPPRPSGMVVPVEVVPDPVAVDEFHLNALGGNREMPLAAIAALPDEALGEIDRHPVIGAGHRTVERGVLHLPT